MYSLIRLSACKYDSVSGWVQRVRNTDKRSLFVGYVLMQIPSNMLITRIKPGYYMSTWMLIWAVVSGCAALVQNYTGLVLVRFFLGITEAPVSRVICSACDLQLIRIMLVLSWCYIYALYILHA